jgi:hypothetical protein
MLLVRRNLIPILGLMLLTGGVLATDTSSPQTVNAEPATIELNALCVNFFTSAVSVSNRVSGTTCPANRFNLLVPDSFPSSLAVTHYTGAVIHARSPRQIRRSTGKARRGPGCWRRARR